MNKKNKGILTLLIAVILAGAFALVFAACEGPEGPIGATGPGADSTLVRSLEATKTNDSITIKFDRPLTAVEGFFVMLYKQGIDPLGTDATIENFYMINDTVYVDNRYTVTFNNLSTHTGYIISVCGIFDLGSSMLLGSETKVFVFTE